MSGKKDIPAGSRLQSYAFKGNTGSLHTETVDLLDISTSEGHEDFVGTASGAQESYSLGKKLININSDSDDDVIVVHGGRSVSSGVGRSVSTASTQFGSNSVPSGTSQNMTSSATLSQKSSGMFVDSSDEDEVISFKRKLKPSSSKSISKKQSPSNSPSGRVLRERPKSQAPFAEPPRLRERSQRSYQELSESENSFHSDSHSDSEDSSPRVLGKRSKVPKGKQMKGSKSARLAKPEKARDSESEEEFSSESEESEEFSDSGEESFDDLDEEDAGLWRGPKITEEQLLEEFKNAGISETARLPFKSLPLHERLHFGKLWSRARSIASEMVKAGGTESGTTQDSTNGAVGALVSSGISKTIVPASLSSYWENLEASGVSPKAIACARAEFSGSLVSEEFLKEVLGWTVVSSSQISSNRSSLPSVSITKPTLSITPYQLVGLNWLLLLERSALGGVLADEMGLGKSVQACALLSWLYRARGRSGPHLLVTPASTCQNWWRELKKWCPGLRIRSYRGGAHRLAYQRALIHGGGPPDPLDESSSPLIDSDGDEHTSSSVDSESSEELDDSDVDELKEKSPNPSSTRAFDVLIVTYNMFDRRDGVSQQDRSFLRRFKWDYLIADEGHNLKNSSSQRFQALNALRTRRRLILSGTPVQNSVPELFALLGFILPELFTPAIEKVFLEALTKNSSKSGNARKGSQAEALRAVLQPFILRRTKATVLADLPPKTDKTLTLELPPPHKHLYRRILLETRLQIAGVKVRRPTPIPLSAWTTEPASLTHSAFSERGNEKKSEMNSSEVEEVKDDATSSSTSNSCSDTTKVGKEAIIQSVSSYNASRLPVRSLEISEADISVTSLTSALDVNTANDLDVSNYANVSNISCDSEVAIGGMKKSLGLKTLFGNTHVEEDQGDFIVISGGTNKQSLQVNSLQSSKSSHLALDQENISLKNVTGDIGEWKDNNFESPALSASLSAIQSQASAASSEGLSDLEDVEYEEFPKNSRYHSSSWNSSNQEITRAGSKCLVVEGGSAVSTESVAITTPDRTTRQKGFSSPNEGESRLIYSPPLRGHEFSPLQPVRVVNSTSEDVKKGENDVVELKSNGKENVGFVDEFSDSFGILPDAFELEPLPAPRIAYQQPLQELEALCNKIESSFDVSTRPVSKFVSTMSTKQSGNYYASLRMAAQHPLLLRRWLLLDSLLDRLAAAFADLGAFGDAAIGDVPRVRAELESKSDFVLLMWCFELGYQGSEVVASVARFLEISSHEGSSLKQLPEDTCTKGGMGNGDGSLLPMKEAMKRLRNHATPLYAVLGASYHSLIREYLSKNNGKATKHVGEALSTNSGKPWQRIDFFQTFSDSNLQDIIPVECAPIDIHPNLTGRSLLRAVVEAVPPWALFSSAKAQHLLRFLPKWIADGHRVLLFSQLKDILSLLEQVLLAMDIDFVRMDGDVPVDVRQRILDKFSGNTDIKVFLLSTRAGGLGLNLTAADTVIIHDFDWNPHQDAQAVDRAHRMGQTKPVSVFRLISGDTVDAHIDKIASSKLELDSALRTDKKGGAFDVNRALQEALKQ